MTAALGLAALIVALVAAPAESRPAGHNHGRPNILVVMTDDMRPGRPPVHAEVQEAAGQAGDEVHQRDHSFPLCCPSRATFLTGQYAHNHGVGGNFYPVGLVRHEGPRQHPPHLAENGGYRTDLIGKMAERLRGA